MLVTINITRGRNSILRCSTCHCNCINYLNFFIRTIA